jgi:branched-chain amino acid transport system ATP-binding protein
MTEATGALLKARGLRMRFGELVVLDGVDFHVQPDEAVGIVGPNGAGKTTLLSALAGAWQPTAGEIFFGGANVTPLGAAVRCRAGLARSHQVPKPFGGMTVFENLRVAATHGGGLQGAAANARCFDALTLTGMARVANRRADALGLLDRKRLELARALATGPKLLLLDEIGGGLTDGEAAELVAVLRELRARHIAMVWIEHIVHILLQVSERLVCMVAGRVIADGEPNTVMSDPTVVEAYLGGSA